MASARRMLIIGFIALVVGACGNPGTRPSAPTTAFRPAAVGVVLSEDSLGCGAQHVVLASGQSIDLTFSASVSDLQTCPPAPVAYRAGGSAGFLYPQVGNLLMWGQDTAGKWWWVEAGNQAGNAEAEKGGFAYGLPGGSFEEGNTFHLPSGLVVDKSATYHAPGCLSSPIVVPEQGGLGLDAQGRVTQPLMPVGCL